MRTIAPNWTVPPHIQAFTTTREGGVSLPPFESFNLGDHVEDDKSAVKTNRTLLVEKFNLPHFPLFLTQTHSTRVITEVFHNAVVRHSRFTHWVNSH